MPVKKILKKILIKICRVAGFEIIDQNQFTFPSLENKEFNNLSTINKQSIVMPLGKVKISRKIEKLSIIVRANSNVHISDQNKKRIFNKDKEDKKLDIDIDLQNDYLLNEGMLILSDYLYLNTNLLFSEAA